MTVAPPFAYFSDKQRNAEKIVEVEEEFGGEPSLRQLGERVLACAPLGDVLVFRLQRRMLPNEPASRLAPGEPLEQRLCSRRSNRAGRIQHACLVAVPFWDRNLHGVEQLEANAGDPSGYDDVAFAHQRIRRHQVLVVAQPGSLARGPVAGRKARSEVSKEHPGQLNNRLAIALSSPAPRRESDLPHGQRSGHDRNPYECPVSDRRTVRNFHDDTVLYPNHAKTLSGHVEPRAVRIEALRETTDSASSPDFRSLICEDGEGR
jgi:hypothetical protein